MKLQKTTFSLKHPDITGVNSIDSIEYENENSSCFTYKTDCDSSVQFFQHTRLGK